MEFYVVTISILKSTVHAGGAGSCCFSHTFFYRYYYRMYPNFKL